MPNKKTKQSTPAVKNFADASKRPAVISSGLGLAYPLFATPQNGQVRQISVLFSEEREDRFLNLRSVKATDVAVSKAKNPNATSPDQLTRYIPRNILQVNNRATALNWAGNTKARKMPDNYDTAGIKIIKALVETGVMATYVKERGRELKSVWYIGDVKGADEKLQQLYIVYQQSVKNPTNDLPRVAVTVSTEMKYVDKYPQEETVNTTFEENTLGAEIGMPSVPDPVNLTGSMAAAMFAAGSTLPGAKAESFSESFASNSSAGIDSLQWDSAWNKAPFEIQDDPIDISHVTSTGMSGITLNVMGCVLAAVIATMVLKAASKRSKGTTRFLPILFMLVATMSAALAGNVVCRDCVVHGRSEYPLANDVAYMDFDCIHDFDEIAVTSTTFGGRITNRVEKIRNGTLMLTGTHVRTFCVCTGDDRVCIDKTNTCLDYSADRFYTIGCVLQRGNIFPTLYSIAIHLVIVSVILAMLRMLWSLLVTISLAVAATKIFKSVPKYSPLPLAPIIKGRDHIYRDEKGSDLEPMFEDKVVLRVLTHDGYNYFGLQGDEIYINFDEPSALDINLRKSNDGTRQFYDGKSYGRGITLTQVCMIMASALFPMAKAFQYPNCVALVDRHHLVNTVEALSTFFGSIESGECPQLPFRSIASIENYYAYSQCDLLGGFDVEKKENKCGVYFVVLPGKPSAISYDHDACVCKIGDNGSRVRRSVQETVLKKPKSTRPCFDGTRSCLNTAIRHGRDLPRIDTSARHSNGSAWKCTARDFDPIILLDDKLSVLCNGWFRNTLVAPHDCLLHASFVGTSSSGELRRITHHMQDVNKRPYIYHDNIGYGKFEGINSDFLNRKSCVKDDEDCVLNCFASSYRELYPAVVIDHEHSSSISVSPKVAYGSPVFCNCHAKTVFSGLVGRAYSKHSRYFLKYSVPHPETRSIERSGLTPMQVAAAYSRCPYKVYNFIKILKPATSPGGYTGYFPTSPRNNFIQIGSYTYKRTATNNFPTSSSITFGYDCGTKMDDAPAFAKITTKEAYSDGKFDGYLYCTPMPKSDCWLLCYGTETSVNGMGDEGYHEIVDNYQQQTFASGNCLSSLTPSGTVDHYIQAVYAIPIHKYLSDPKSVPFTIDLSKGFVDNEVISGGDLCSHINVTAARTFMDVHNGSVYIDVDVSYSGMCYHYDVLSKLGDAIHDTVEIRSIFTASNFSYTAELRINTTNDFRFMQLRIPYVPNPCRGRIDKGKCIEVKTQQPPSNSTEFADFSPDSCVPIDRTSGKCICKANHFITVPKMAYFKDCDLTRELGGNAYIYTGNEPRIVKEFSSDPIVIDGYVASTSDVYFNSTNAPKGPSYLAGEYVNPGAPDAKCLGSATETGFKLCHIWNSKQVMTLLTLQAGLSVGMLLFTAAAFVVIYFHRNRKQIYDRLLTSNTSVKAIQSLKPYASNIRVFFITLSFFGLITCFTLFVLVFQRPTLFVDAQARPTGFFTESLTASSSAAFHQLTMNNQCVDKNCTGKFTTSTRMSYQHGSSLVMNADIPGFMPVQIGILVNEVRPIYTYKYMYTVSPFYVAMNSLTMCSDELNKDQIFWSHPDAYTDNKCGSLSWCGSLEGRNNCPKFFKWTNSFANCVGDGCVQCSGGTGAVAQYFVGDYSKYSALYQMKLQDVEVDVCIFLGLEKYCRTISNSITDGEIQFELGKLYYSTSDISSNFPFESNIAIEYKGRDQPVSTGRVAMGSFPTWSSGTPGSAFAYQVTEVPVAGVCASDTFFNGVDCLSINHGADYPSGWNYNNPGVGLSYNAPECNKDGYEKLFDMTVFKSPSFYDMIIKNVSYVGKSILPTESYIPLSSVVFTSSSSKVFSTVIFKGEGVVTEPVSANYDNLRSFSVSSVTGTAGSLLNAVLSFHLENSGPAVTPEFKITVPSNAAINGMNPTILAEKVDYEIEVYYPTPAKTTKLCIMLGTTEFLCSTLEHDNIDINFNRTKAMPVYVPPNSYDNLDLRGALDSTWSGSTIATMGAVGTGVAGTIGFVGYKFRSLFTTASSWKKLV